MFTLPAPPPPPTPPVPDCDAPQLQERTSIQPFLLSMPDSPGTSPTLINMSTAIDPPPSSDATSVAASVQRVLSVRGSFGSGARWKIPTTGTHSCLLVRKRNLPRESRWEWNLL